MKTCVGKFGTTIPNTLLVHNPTNFIYRTKKKHKHSIHFGPFQTIYQRVYFPVSTPNKDHGKKVKHNEIVLK